MVCNGGGSVCINADIEEVKTIHPANGKENVLITLQEVNELLANKKLGKINHFRNVSFPYAEKMMLVNTTSNKVLIDLTKKEIIWSQPLSPKAANQDWNKESRSLAYTLDNNLFVTTADGGKHNKSPMNRKASYADKAYTVRNLVSQKVLSGVRKEICLLSTVWTRAW